MSKKEVEITSWNDANDALRRMGELKIDNTLAAAEYQQVVDIAQAALDVVKLPNDKEYADLESKIRAFAARNKADCLGKSRTKKLSFGKVSWKLTAGKVELVNDERLVILNLRTLGHDECVRTVEEVNKDAVLNLGEGVLIRAGIEIKRTDKCTIKPDLEKIKEEVAA